MEKLNVFGNHATNPSTLELFSSSMGAVEIGGSARMFAKNSEASRFKFDGLKNRQIEQLLYLL
jgi:hypothetical protein